MLSSYHPALVATMWLWGGCALVAAQTPDLETCSAPAMPFGGEFGPPSVIEDVITVTDDAPVGDLQVLTEITHTFIGDIFLDLEHAGTTVRLHFADGGADDDIRVVFDDAGAPNGAEPYDCECHIQPSGPGAMVDFLAADPGSDWTLTVTDQFPDSDDGVLERWCLQFYETPPPPPPPSIQNLFCLSPPSSGVVQAAWTNPIGYDEFQVFIDGAFVMTLPGAAVGFTSPPQSIPSLVTVTVKGIINGIPSPARSCEVAVMEAIDVLSCVSPGAPISSDLLPVVSPNVVSESMVIGDLQVRVEITHTFIGDLQVSVTSPSSTTTILHENLGADANDIILTYWEFGVPNGSLPYDCDCFMEPSGPGFLLDFVGENTQGTWNLLVLDFFSGDEGLLNQWCVQAFENQPVFPVSLLTCTSGLVPGTVDVSWMNALSYDFIDVFMDGVLETTLAGPFVAGEFSAYTTLPRPAPGTVNICLVPRLGGVDGSQRCCNVNVVLASVEDLVLTTEGGTGSAFASWTNPLAYDAIEVTLNDDAPIVLPGDTTTFLAVVNDIPGPARLAVRGVLNSFGTSLPGVGAIMVLPFAAIEGCSTPMLPVSNTLPPTVDTIVLVDDQLVIDLEVSISLTHTFLGDLAVDLTSPTGTQLRLHDQGGSSTNDLLLLWNDEGVANGAEPFDCGCVMQPSGTGGMGSLADLADQIAGGEWTLSVEDLIAADEGLFRNWCLRVTEACDLLPPTDVTCTPQSGNVVLMWTNGDIYSAIDIERDGVVVGTTTGTATSFVDPSVPPGGHSYRILGRQSLGGCASPSQRCIAAFGITDIVFRGELPALSDSVGAIQTALEGLGAVVYVVDTLDLDTLSPPDSDVAAVWLALGTFPDNHPLTFSEGQALAEIHTGDIGLDGTPDQDPVPVYIEGADVWGFDAATPFADYDGVDAFADDGDDSLVFVTGRNSLVGLNLAGAGLDDSYLHDQSGNDFTDRIQPAVAVPDLGGPDAGVIWSWDDDVDPYDVGIFYQSTVAPVIAQSFELGGYFGDTPTLVEIYRGALLGLPPTRPEGTPFRRGDADANGIASIADAVFSLIFLFLEGAAPPCLDAADVDDDGGVALPDVIVLLGYLFGMGPPPPVPGPDACGDDGSPDLLPACAYPEELCP